MHSVQAGYTEKALSYADKAMQFIDQQKGLCDHFSLHSDKSGFHLEGGSETLTRGDLPPPPLK